MRSCWSTLMSNLSAITSSSSSVLMDLVADSRMSLSNSSRELPCS
ncbi:Uncharacterised protein [Mycobacteroides abscessus subsp. abscessus]|nr:Uncharacterised protein [Mycobacteroides abscessus subsp. abscessus]